MADNSRLSLDQTPLTILTNTRRIAARPRRGAFTLVEALVAIAVTAIAGSALLLAVESSQETAGNALERTLADGMARQLMDEIMGRRYCAIGASPYDASLTASSTELNGANRSAYNDIDDYNGYVARPACDTWGIELGRGNGGISYRHPNFQLAAGTFANWREKVSVYYVDSAKLSVRLPAGQSSDCRGVEVGIYRVSPDGTERLVTTVRRIVAYVPPPL